MNEYDQSTQSARPSGSQSVQGTQAVQGTPGTQGAHGTPGIQGTQGVQGNQGTQVPGTQGSSLDLQGLDRYVTTPIAIPDSLEKRSEETLIRSLATRVLYRQRETRKNHD